MATLMYNNHLPALRPARTFDQLFSQLLNDTLPGGTTLSKGFVPTADVLEVENGYAILLTVPGIPKDALTIDVQDGTLTVSGERKSPITDENNQKLRRAESAYGSFSRQFRLPDTVDVANIQAELTDGVLRLSLPFDANKTAKRQIEVR